MESLWTPQSVLYHSSNRSNGGSKAKANFPPHPRDASNRKRDREFGSGSSMSKRRSPDDGVPVPSSGGVPPTAGKGFLRLDSLEGNCITHPTATAATLHYSETEPINLGRFHKFSPTRQESRWFANGLPTPFPTSVSFQTPLNLGTGEQEIWQTFSGHHVGHVYATPSMPLVQQSSHRVEYSSLPDMTSFVSNIFGQVMDTVANISCSLISNLNPNARSFTPLNPNAKEFTPSSRVEEEGMNFTSSNESEQVSPTHCLLTSNCEEASTKDSSPGVGNLLVTPSVGDCEVTTDSALVTPPPSNGSSERSTPVNAEEEHEAMKSVAMHQVTPWLTTGKASPPQVKSEATWRRRRLSSNSDSELLNDSITESTDTGEDSSRNRSVNRLLSTSSCSSDESYIEFSSALDSPSKDSPNCSNHDVLNGKLGRSLYISDSEEDDDADEDQDDDGWDDMDDSLSSGTLVEIPDEFKNCGLACPMQAVTNVRNTVEFPKEERNNSDLDSIVFEPERFPSIGRSSDNDTRQKLLEINQRWSNSVCIADATDTNGSPGKRVGCERSKKGVKFSSPELWRSYSEAPDMADELRASRISDYARRKADQERFERVIAPILTKDHREKVFQRMCVKDSL